MSKKNKEKKAVKKSMRKPSNRNVDLDKFVSEGKAPETSEETNTAPSIPGTDEAEYGTASIHAPYEVIDEIGDLLRDARRNHGNSHSRTGLLRAFMYAFVHAPSEVQDELLASEDDTEMFHVLLERLQAK